MPTEDKSQSRLINRIRARTLFFAHFSEQQDLNNGKANRMNSNGDSASIISEYALGAANTTESEIQILITPTNSAGTSNNPITSSPVTPNPTIPNTPTNINAVSGNGQSIVSWIAPSSGGLALLYYIITDCDAA
jgi:hypothetical protein